MTLLVSDRASFITGHVASAAGARSSQLDTHIQPLLEGDRVAECADVRHGDLDHVTVAQVSRWDSPVADATRGAGGDQVARLEGEAAREVLDQVDDRMDHLGGRCALHLFSAHDGPQLEIGEVEAGRLHQARADRGERVEALAEGELRERRLELGAATRHVVERGHRADGLRRRLAGRPVGPAPDHDAHLALEVRSRLFARHDDRLLGPDDRRRELGEQDRHGGHVVLRFDGVLAVVDADREDLRRTQRRAQAHGREVVPRSIGIADALPPFGRRYEAGVVDRTRVDDRLVLQPAQTAITRRRFEDDGAHVTRSCPTRRPCCSHRRRAGSHRSCDSRRHRREVGDGCQPFGEHRYESRRGHDSIMPTTGATTRSWPR